MIRHIVFRCVQCRGTTSVQAEWTRRDLPTEVVCVDCNAIYSLPARRDRGVSNRDYYEKARRFASENNIDLPSAYSVLEEILPRDKVRTLAKGSPELVETQGSTTLRTLALFSAVVVALAFVGGYYRDRIAAPFTAGRGGAPTEPVRVGATRSVRRATPKPATPEGISFVPILLQTNDTGAITKVAGPDPKSVLLAFCRQPGISERLTPVTVSHRPRRPARACGWASCEASMSRKASIPSRSGSTVRRADGRSGNGSHAIKPVELDLGDATHLPLEATQ